MYNFFNHIFPPSPREFFLLPQGSFSLFLVTSNNQLTIFSSYLILGKVMEEFISLDKRHVNLILFVHYSYNNKEVLVWLVVTGVPSDYNKKNLPNISDGGPFGRSSNE